MFWDAEDGATPREIGPSAQNLLLEDGVSNERPIQTIAVNTEEISSVGEIPPERGEDEELASSPHQNTRPNSILQTPGLKLRDSVTSETGVE